MKIEVLDDRRVVISAHGSLCHDEQSATALVRSAMQDGGLLPWQYLELETFNIGEDVLIIARPQNDMYVEIADYVLPFLF